MKSHVKNKKYFNTCMIRIFKTHNAIAPYFTSKGDYCSYGKSKSFDDVTFEQYCKDNGISDV